MLSRLTLLTLVPMLCAACAACAGEPSSPKVMGYQAVATPLVASAVVETASAPTGRVQVPPRKSMADKVLTAIALERVTGRKPDPARLAEAW